MSGRGPGKRKGTARGRSAETPAVSGRLGVRPARLVRRGNANAAELEGALRVLYRDYLAGGGLDFVRARSCSGLPNATEEQGKR